MHIAPNSRDAEQSEQLKEFRQSKVAEETRRSGKAVVFNRSKMRKERNGNIKGKR